MANMERLRAHSEVFDMMIALIPPECYYRKEDAEKATAAGAPHMRFSTLKKRSAEQMGTQMRKEASKKGKKAKENEVQGILDAKIKKFALSKEGEEPAEPLSLSQLRSQVKAKLAEASEGRKAKIQNLADKRSEDKAKRKLEGTREDHRTKRKDTKAMREEAKQAHASDDDDDEPVAHDDEEQLAVEDEEEEQMVGVDFRSNAKVDAAKPDPWKQQRKGASVYKKLKDAEALNRQIASIEDPQERKKALEEAQWDKALKQAQGGKVLNDTRLLQKSIKRREKAKKRSSTKWADRQKTVEEMKAERQEKRKFNIAAHQQRKKDWKAGLKVKKKPGFEGKYTSLPKKGEKQKQRKDKTQKSKYKKVKV